MLKKETWKENTNIDLTSSTTASDTDTPKEKKPVTEHIVKKIGRPRKVYFDNCNTEVVEVE